MTEPVDGMQVVMGFNAVVNLVRVVVYPVETVEALAMLWKAQSVLSVAPDVDGRCVVAGFRDENGERVGAVDVVEPVADTDYTVNSAADGGGRDYTSSEKFEVTTTIEATRAVLELANTANRTLYVTLLKIRGKPILVWDPIVIEKEDTTSQAAFEKCTKVLDLPMQADTLFAESYANYLLGRYADPFVRVEEVTIRGRDTIGGVNVFSLDLMDKVLVNDEQAGVSLMAHWIRGVEYDLSATSFVTTLRLERADDRQYWLLGETGYSELGETTYPGF